MYAVIRAGGKQYKVAEGDVIDVERVDSSSKVEFTPVLVVDDDGKAYADRKELSKAKVTAKVVGESKGPKLRIFKYRSKTRYRRKSGHRQSYSSIEISGIKLGARKTTAQAKKTGS